MKSIELGSQALVGRNDSSCSLKMESVLHWMSYYSDLPNLTSFTSKRNSFNQPRSVTLSSMISNS